jgi:hypothetical protein
VHHDKIPGNRTAKIMRYQGAFIMTCNCTSHMHGVTESAEKLWEGVPKQEKVHINTCPETFNS